MTTSGVKSWISHNTPYVTAIAAILGVTFAALVFIERLDTRTVAYVDAMNKATNEAIARCPGRRVPAMETTMANHEIRLQFAETDRLRLSSEVKELGNDLDEVKTAVNRALVILEAQHHSGEKP